MSEYKRNKDGYYRKSIVVGRTPDGKQKRVTVRSKSLSEFKMLVQSAELQRATGYDFDIKDITVSQWGKQWFDAYKRPLVSRKTADNTWSRMQRYIFDSIGNIRMIDIREFMLQDLLNACAGKSKSFLSKLMQCIKSMFQRALGNGIITLDVYSGLRMPLYSNKSHRPITDAERTHIKQVAATHRSGLWVLIMLYFGLRPEETVPLMWSDFNFDKNQLKVCRAVEWVQGRPKIKKLKGKEKKVRSERILPIPSEIKPTLVDEYQHRKGLYVFSPAESNGMLTQSHLKKMWKSFKRALDIDMGAELYRNKIVVSKVADDLTPYCLRHTYATDMYKLTNHDIKAVQYLMGHEKVETTLNIYIHCLPVDIDQICAMVNPDSNLQGRQGVL